MALNLKAKETLVQIGKYMGTYRYVLSPVIYNKLSEDKVVEEACVRSNLAKSVLQSAWNAIGDVIQAWATEGHSVAIPGLGTMRFGVRAKSVETVAEVASGLITARRVIFTPNVDIKEELQRTAIQITCYDKDGKVIKNVTSGDGGSVEDPDNTPGGGDNNPGGGSGTNGGGSGTNGGGSDNTDSGKTDTGDNGHVNL